MIKRETQKFKKLLLAESEHLLKGIRTIGKDTLEAANGETAMRLASGESQMLREVADALQRIEEGNYGKCMACEKEIPKKRLEVFPAAKRCVECESKHEKELNYR